MADCGTVSGYSLGCRCKPCATAAAVAFAEWRRRVLETHDYICGTRRGWRVGCSCELCWAVGADDRYKLPPGTILAMLERQDRRCAICRNPFTRRPYVDHDHSCCPKRSCGKCVRGLLCSGCNTLLGVIERRPAELFSFFSYIARSNSNDRNLGMKPWRSNGRWEFRFASTKVY